MDENKNTNGAEEVMNEETGEQASVTMESLMTDIAKLKAENAKTKTALDKALHNNGELTKQLRAKMSASEQEEEAKKAQEEAQRQRIQDLEDYKRRSEARERYLTFGMSPENAKAAAEAEVSGDMETLGKIQQRHTTELIKAKEAEWLKSRPEANAGHGEDDAAKDPFLLGFNKG